MPFTATIEAMPMMIARKCVEAVSGNGNFHGMSSGWAIDKVKEIETKLCAIYNREPGRTTQGKIIVPIWTDSDGTTRILIDTDDHYYDHVIKM